ncbi:MAG: hypothetical protein ABI766_15185, partial [Gemmatimonadales bacterium]
EDLTAAVDEFDASVDATNDGLLDHVSARAELKAASDEVVRLVGMLDGLNRYRFDREPQLLAAWESARHVVAGTVADVPVEGLAPGEVKPAA